ncbi:hypothetical protein BC940DRAFT_44019 [Gongronella butleri]|nr:hypothetical protein BC940DRAFT_44019 [Gongronella butleri]
MDPTHESSPAHSEGGEVPYSFTSVGGNGNAVAPVSLASLSAGYAPASRWESSTGDEEYSPSDNNSPSAGVVRPTASGMLNTNSSSFSANIAALVNWRGGAFIEEVPPSPTMSRISALDDSGTATAANAMPEQPNQPNQPNQQQSPADAAYEERERAYKQQEEAFQQQEKTLQQQKEQKEQQEQQGQIYHAEEQEKSYYQAQQPRPIEKMEAVAAEPSMPAATTVSVIDIFMQTIRQLKANVATKIQLQLEALHAHPMDMARYQSLQQSITLILTQITNMEVNCSKLERIEGLDDHPAPSPHPVYAPKSNQPLYKQQQQPQQPLQNHYQGHQRRVSNTSLDYTANAQKYDDYTTRQHQRNDDQESVSTAPSPKRKSRPATNSNYRDREYRQHNTAPYPSNTTHRQRSPVRERNQNHYNAHNNNNNNNNANKKYKRAKPKCLVCSTEFNSHDQLMKHLSDSGHRLRVDQINEVKEYNDDTVRTRGF